MTDPSARDLVNAAARQAIAVRERTRYALAEAYSLSLFGQGFRPHGYHTLIDSSDADRLRFARERPEPAATVYSARKGAEERFFVVEDGHAREVAGIQDGFGDMLHEKHPTKRITVKGREVSPARYELCWGWFDGRYRPRSAEELAVARQKREEKRERTWQEEVNTAADASLFPEWYREQAEEQRKNGNRR